MELRRVIAAAVCRDSREGGRRYSRRTVIQLDGSDQDSERCRAKLFWVAGELRIALRTKIEEISGAAAARAGRLRVRGAALEGRGRSWCCEGKRVEGGRFMARLRGNEAGHRRWTFRSLGTRCAAPGREAGLLPRSAAAACAGRDWQQPEDRARATTSRVTEGAQPSIRRGTAGARPARSLAEKSG